MTDTVCCDDTLIIQEIEKYLSEFRSVDLVEGAKVRDAFLDLRSLVANTGKTPGVNASNATDAECDKQPSD